MSFSLAAKSGLGFIARACNVLDTLSRNPRKSIVLGYHRVIPPTSNQSAFCESGMYVTPDTLRRHLVFLKQHYKLVTLTELLEHDSSENCCAITFDDGWWDNYEYAYPVLKEFAVPATIFLATGFIESQQWPWTDRILFYEQVRGHCEIEELFNQSLSVLHRPEIPGNKNSIAFLMREMKKLSHPDIVHIMELIDARFSDLYDALHCTKPAMTWEQVREMMGDAMEFGIHSHAHIIANQATPAAFLESDYFESAQLFKYRLGRKPCLFAYPNGDYSSAAVHILKKLHIKASVTTQPGFIDRDHPMTLKRVLIHEDVSSTENLFAFKLISSLVV